MKKQFSDFGIAIPFFASGKGKINIECPQCAKDRKKKNTTTLAVWIEDGNWSCIHCGWKGSIYVKEEKQFRRPAYTPRAEMSDKTRQWFLSRKISEEALVRNNVTDGMMFMPQTSKEENCIQFPYFRGGEVINVKYRDGRKNFRMEKDAERIFYKWNDLFTSDGKVHSWVIICEGEIDALSFESVGIKQCLSVPDGAPTPDAKNYSSKFEFLDRAMDSLLQCERIYIAADNDAAGITLEKELVRRLGAERCLKISWPEGCKDANDVLVKCEDNALWKSFRGAKEYPVAGIVAPVELQEEIESLYETGIYKQGVSTGWRCLDELYRPTPSQVTVLTAIPNIGKSEVIDAMLINIAVNEGWRFAMYSPENHPHSEHAIRLLMKHANAPFFAGFHARMSSEDRNVSLVWLQEHFRWIDLGDEEPTLPNILAKAEHLVKHFGINGLVIDPYNELDHSRPSAMTETEYISRFMSTLRRFTRKHTLHSWLIAHPTKLQKLATNKRDDKGVPIMTYGVPTLYDIAGSAHFRNKTDVGIALHRDQLDDRNITDVHVQKMRFARSGKIGKASLKWDSVTGRFSPVEFAEQFGAF